MSDVDKINRIKDKVDEIYYSIDENEDYNIKEILFDLRVFINSILEQV